MKLLALILAADEVDAQNLAALVQAPDLAGFRAVLMELKPTPKWWERDGKWSFRAKNVGGTVAIYDAPNGRQIRFTKIPPVVDVSERTEDGWLKVYEKPVMWARAVDLDPAE